MEKVKKKLKTKRVLIYKNVNKKTAIESELNEQKYHFISFQVIYIFQNNTVGVTLDCPVLESHSTLPN